MKKITIRPSSLSGLEACPAQWYQTHIMGKKSIPNMRMLQGTVIHYGVENYWRQAMATQRASGITDACFVRDFSSAPSFNEVNDSINESLKLELSKGVVPDATLNKNTVLQNAISGVQAFVQSIVPATKIPEAVETKFVKKLDHPLIEEIAGTADYLAYGVIADIKSSKSACRLDNYTLQQSTYKMLAEHNGVPIHQNLIQGVIKTPAQPVYAKIYEMPDISVPKVDYLLQTLMSKLEILADAGVDLMDYNHPMIQALFGGNTQWNLCDPKYCNFYKNCKFVHGIRSPMFQAQPQSPFQAQPMVQEATLIAPDNTQTKVSYQFTAQPQVQSPFTAQPQNVSPFTAQVQ